jgi:hypothetical protein
LTLLADWFAGPKMVFLIFRTEAVRTLDSFSLAVYNLGLIVPNMKRIESFVDVALLESGHLVPSTRLYDTEYAMKMRWYGSISIVSVWF